MMDCYASSEFDLHCGQQYCQKEIDEGLFDQWQHIKLFLDDWLSSWRLPRGIQRKQDTSDKLSFLGFTDSDVCMQLINIRTEQT